MEAHNDEHLFLGNYIQYESHATLTTVRTKQNICMLHRSSNLNIEMNLKITTIITKKPFLKIMHG